MDEWFDSLSKAEQIALVCLLVLAAFGFIHLYLFAQ